MFVRRVILLCFACALLAPLADAKMPKPPKRQNAHSNKKIKRGPKAKWGSYKVKNKHS